MFSCYINLPVVLVHSDINPTSSDHFNFLIDLNALFSLPEGGKLLWFWSRTPHMNQSVNLDHPFLAKELLWPNTRWDPPDRPPSSAGKSLSNGRMARSLHCLTPIWPPKAPTSTFTGMCVTAGSAVRNLIHSFHSISLLSLCSLKCCPCLNAAFSWMAFE